MAVEWLRWNLKHEAGQDYTKKIKWATLFGYICWDIWVTRCGKLHGSNVPEDQSKAQTSFFRACWDKELADRCRFYYLSGSRDPATSGVQEGTILLEVDGSVKSNGSSGCGGALYGSNLSWICGFRGRLVSTPPAIATILGIWNGLQLCWAKGYRSIILLTTCIDAVNLITRGCDYGHPFRDIIDDVRFFVHRDRDDMFFAGYLADSSNEMIGTFCVLNQPPNL